MIGAGFRADSSLATPQGGTQRRDNGSPNPQKFLHTCEVGAEDGTRLPSELGKEVNGIPMGIASGSACDWSPDARI